MKILLYCLLSLLFLFPISLSAQAGIGGPFPVITDVTISNICEDGRIQLSVEADSQNLPLKYKWSNGYQVKDNEPSKPGLYYVTITDNKGNSIVGGPYEIKEIGPRIFYVEKQSDCNDQKLGYLHVVTKSSSDKLEWSHDPTLITGNADNLLKGFYKLKLTSASGLCEREEILQVHSYTPVIKKLEIGGISDCVTYPNTSGFIAIDLLYDHPPCYPCFGGEAPFVSFTGQSGILYFYSMGYDLTFPPMFEWDGTIKGLPKSGFLKLHINDNGCSIDTTIFIPNLDPLTYNLLTTTPDKETQIYTAFSSPKGGQGPFTYLWSDGSTDATRTDLLVGKTYFVTVTDVYGCTSTTKTFIKKKKGAYKLQVIPNKNLLDVRSSEEDSIQYTYMVFDAFGKVYSLKENILSDNDRQFDITNLAAGVYYLSVQSEDNIESYPFVVMK